MITAKIETFVVFSPPGGGQIRASRIEDTRQHVARTFGLQVEELKQRSTTGGKGDQSPFPLFVDSGAEVVAEGILPVAI